SSCPSASTFATARSSAPSLRRRTSGSCSTSSTAIRPCTRGRTGSSTPGCFWARCWTPGRTTGRRRPISTRREAGGRRKPTRSSPGGGARGARLGGGGGGGGWGWPPPARVANPHGVEFQRCVGPTLTTRVGGGTPPPSPTLTCRYDLRLLLSRGLLL